MPGLECILDKDPNNEVFHRSMNTGVVDNFAESTVQDVHLETTEERVREVLRGIAGLPCQPERPRVLAASRDDACQVEVEG